MVLAVIRLVQRQSMRYVVQAVIPTAIAAVVAARTGRAEDVFLPGILYNGALAVIALHQRRRPAAAGRLHHRRRHRRPDRLGHAIAGWSG